MSKNHRGRGIRSYPAHGRGVCAICKRDGVKILYEQTIDGETVKICKICNAHLKNKARAEAPAKVQETPAAEDAATTEAPAESAE